MQKEGPWNLATYEELRRIAETLMGGERNDHTLRATGLVHEVWLRLRKSQNADSLQRGAFLGTAAQAMRHILTDHARRKDSAKRGGGHRRTTLQGKSTRESPREFALGLDAALTKLESKDPELSRLVELKFYGEADIPEIARELGLSTRTVKRRYRYAKAWLQNKMQEQEWES